MLRHLQKWSENYVLTGLLVPQTFVLKLNPTLSCTLLAEFADVPSSDHSIVREHPTCGLKPLNRYQEAAVREALVKPLTLVQGPPGN